MAIVDAAEDLPELDGAHHDGVLSGSRQLSAFLRRTRQNKIRKILREVYLRDDIQPELFEGAEHIMVLDTAVVMRQIDFIAEEECVNHVVVPHTVLQEVRAQHGGTYARLRALCRVEMEGEGVEESSSAGQGKFARHMQHHRNPGAAHNSRKFYVFPNEFFRETYVTRSSGESQRDRNNRAVRQVVQWYQRLSSGPEVYLLTDDKECQAAAVREGLPVLKAKDYVEKMRTKFPEAGEKLAVHAEDDEVMEGGSSGSQEKRPANDGEGLFPAHMKSSEIEAALKAGKVQQGVLRMHMNTSAFASVACGGEELEVSGRQALNRAIDGDIVAIEKVQDADLAEPPAKRRRLDENGNTPPQGRVVGIIKRNWREYCGTLRPLTDERGGAAGSFGSADRIFIPADARIPNIRVQTRQSANLENKRIVVMLDSWDRNSNYPNGHWTKILGDVGDRSVESAVILHEHGVTAREFGESVLRCLPPADWTVSEADLVGRKDFRKECVCSIDPPGCKDIDDAVHCKRLKNGNLEVGVHIADVTHFVKPGSAVDKEASERCTTVYLVERRTDMFPGLLTTDICSLRGKLERLTFSVVWEMTPNAEIVDTKFYKGVICSRAAMSYAEAQARIDDPSDTSELTSHLRTLLKVTRLIRQRRMEAGALELSSQEVRFELDSETSDPTDVAEYQLRETNKLIEELMLLANTSVAKKILSDFPQFSVLRRHPAPKDEACKSLAKLLDKHGLKFHYGTNKEFGKSLDAAVKPGDPFFNKLVRMLACRCMNQAVYFCTGEVQEALYGHFGLAMERYTHFTSPIRRYADVLVHRFLAASLGIEPLPDALQQKSLISEQCELINLKNRMSQFASRVSVDLHTFLYFKKRGPQDCMAVVTRVRKNGLQVNIPRYGIEGFVSLPEEEWDVDEDEQLAKSKVASGEQVSIFGKVTVKITADDADFRNRTSLTFLGVASKPKAIESFAETEAACKEAQKEMFPDRLVREDN
mmetsp:Transcript_35375/g.82717  ORF Transcript_35375/g.82717 Transcript_35375/m.82717 type:complete len:986 (-) Transcript_35375:87-3044(-)